jgi:hypothetical protein
MVKEREILDNENIKNKLNLVKITKEKRKGREE